MCGVITVAGGILALRVVRTYYSRSGFEELKETLEPNPFDPKAQKELESTDYKTFPKEEQSTEEMIINSSTAELQKIEQIESKEQLLKNFPKDNKQ